MKFTLSWLKSHLDTNKSAAELADKLTWLGLEVESMDNPAEKLAAFTIAHVESAEKHPNADRLKVLQVNTGTEKVQVVCGAPNARAGMKGVFAPPGTYVPGIDVTLKISKIRDVDSRGMMCSKRELQLSDEHEGIIELPDDAPVGMPFADYAKLNDPVFEVKLTPNRPDCTSVRGIARDLAAAGMGTLKPQKIDAVKGSFKSPINVTLDFGADTAKACPYFIGRMIKGVKNGPSPQWLQNYLTRINLRPISALVDITNFMTFDQGRPLHVFDAAKVKGNLHARLAKDGETILALNGKEYTLDSSMTVIADDAKAEAIAGIIGGEESGCSETTTDVFLECAYFDPSRTTLTGRKLNVLSDARYRFERGVDPAFMPDAVEMATKLIIELCGGEPSDVVVAGTMPDTARTVQLPFTRCKTLGGLDVPVSEQEQMLKAIGCDVKKGADSFTVTFPSWRPDMVGAADCVEEILRLKGFEEIQPVSLPRDAGLTRTALNPQQKRAATVKRALASRGMLEAVTWSFMPSAIAQHFTAVNPDLRIMNPISADLDVLRSSILPNLLQAANRNAARGFADVALFEVGPIFKSAQMEGQSIVAAGIRAGKVVPRQWNAAERAPDLFDAKADALAALEAAKAPVGNLQATPDAPAYFHPGRSGVLRLGPTVLAHFGEIHPAIAARLGLEGVVSAFEIFLDAIPAARDTGSSKPLADLPDLQPVRRDYAFVLDRGVEADKLLKAVRSADKALIADAAVFDLYEGKGVPEGQKSLAIEVRFQPRDKTLTEAEIEALSSKIIAAAAKAGAVLRQ
jgi:phenylalanyl-tRNA synthetase beta chain